jgi:SAM-dependent methyltransferase
MPVGGGGVGRRSPVPDRWETRAVHTRSGPDGSSDAAAAERLLHAAVDRSGAGPLPWMAAPLADAGLVLDICCGTGPLAGHFAPGRWLGVDPAARPHGGRPLVRAAPTALPVPANAVDGVVLALALPLLSAVDTVFAEIRRVLRPSGTLVVVVPSGTTGSLAELRFAPLLSAVHRWGWTNRSALDNTAWLLAAADFAVLSNDRVPFTVPLPDATAALALADDLPEAGFWPPAMPADVRARAVRALVRRAGPGRSLPVPLRRLVARR